MLANAGFMARRMLVCGWDTVVVDIDWHDPAPRAGGYTGGALRCLDGYGLPTPAGDRFPSAAHGTGFTWLAARVHELGLRFGAQQSGHPEPALWRPLRFWCRELPFGCDASLNVVQGGRVTLDKRVKDTSLNELTDLMVSSYRQQVAGGR